jgi:hypothetical protein
MQDILSGLVGRWLYFSPVDMALVMWLWRIEVRFNRSENNNSALQSKVDAMIANINLLLNNLAERAK